MSAAPPLPRHWLGTPPDPRTLKFCLFTAAGFGVPGMFGLRATLDAVAAHDVARVAAYGLLTLFPLAIALGMLLPVLNPRPHLTATGEGLSIDSAGIVAATVALVGLSLLMIVTILGASVLGGHLIGSTTAGQRRSYAFPVLAVFIIAILVPYMARTAIGRMRGARPRFQVTLTPAGIQFSDKGNRYELDWDAITDIQIGPPSIGWGQRLGPSQLYLYTAAGGEQHPFMVDRWLQQGGLWLYDTVRYYRDNPAARAELGSPAALATGTPQQSAGAPASGPSRTRVTWRAVAWAAAWLLWVVWLTVAISMTLDHSTPMAANRFPSGGSTTVTLTATDYRTIYVSGETAVPRCAVTTTDPQGSAEIGTSTRATRFPRTDNQDWQPVGNLNPRRAGTYTLSCAAGPDAIFGLAAPRGPREHFVVGTLFLALTALLVRWMRRRRAPRSPAGDH
jgi:hypothetical protein